MQRVWYVAYGSNTALSRFRCYLSGGRPDGAARMYDGCRDPSEPTGVAAVSVTGELVFAGESLVWGGGMAFYDPAGTGSVAGRAYLVTLEQFVDIVAQEMRQPVGGELAGRLTELLPEMAEVHVAGPGRYETIRRLGERDDVPMLTMTCDALAAMPLTPPSARYLWWVAQGLREAHEWPPAQIATYLAAARGAARHLAGDGDRRAGPTAVTARLRLRQDGGVDPIEALSEIAFWKERGREETRRVEAYRKAAWTLEALPEGELEERIASKTVTDVPLVGPSTSAVVMEAAKGGVPKKLAELRKKGKRRWRPAARSCGPSCAATCTHTPTGPTAGRRSARWPRSPARSATSTSR